MCLKTHCPSNDIAAAGKAISRAIKLIIDNARAISLLSLRIADRSSVSFKNFDSELQKTLDPLTLSALILAKI